MEMNNEDYYDRINDALARASSGLPGAIHAMCVSCRYDPADKGGPLDQVRACDAPECPLFPHRPKADDRPAELVAVAVAPEWNPRSQWPRKTALIRSKQEQGSQRAAIDGYCIDCTVDLSPDEPGTWSQQVAGCQQRECPLHGVRAKSRAERHGDRDGYKSKILAEMKKEGRRSIPVEPGPMRRST